MTTDPTTAATAPFEPTPQHQLLASFAGRWTGETQLYLDPTAPPEVSRTDATIEPVLGGRWVRIDHCGTAMSRPHAGVLTLGFHKDAQEFEASLIDSFHTGTAMMLSVGALRADGVVDVLGSYAAGAERWGWRTMLRLEGDELVIEARNISPAGEEYPAITTRLRRA